jgi:hypothetical protein
MTNISIDILIILEHQFQVVKCVFVEYHLIIESNILLLLCGSTEITLHVLCFRPPKPKTFFTSKVYLHNSNFWSTIIILLSTETTSSAKSIHQWIPPLLDADLTKDKNLAFKPSHHYLTKFCKDLLNVSTVESTSNTPITHLHTYI